MRLLITENIGEWVANYVADTIKTRQAEVGKVVLGLPTGSSPLSMYRELINKYKAKQLSFKNVITFNMDEYVGLARDHKQSYYHFMMENFFNHIDIDKNNIHIPNGVAEDLMKECAQYEQSIEDAGKIDLMLCGAGEDGHLAFNEPYSSLSSKTRVKHLTNSTREANARFFESKDGVPTDAITVGIDTIMSSRQVVVLVSGYKKAKTLQALIEEGVSSKFPISILQMHPKVIVVADRASCIELKVKTYRYFKYLEDEFTNLYPRV